MSNDTLEAAPVIRKDPKEEIDEILEFFKYSLKSDAQWKGTVVFDMPKTESSPPILFSVRVDPDTRDVTTWYSMPPDGRYSAYVDISRDDFLYLYSGAAGAAAVASMFLTGRIKVRWLRLREVQAFATSFDYATPRWVAFYRGRGQHDAADALIRQQWANAAKNGTLVDDDGTALTQIECDALPEEKKSRLKRLGELWLQGLSFAQVQNALEHTAAEHPIVFDDMRDNVHVSESAVPTPSVPPEEIVAVEPLTEQVMPAAQAEATGLNVQVMPSLQAVEPSAAADIAADETSRHADISMDTQYSGVSKEAPMSQVMEEVVQVPLAVPSVGTSAAAQDSDVDFVLLLPDLLAIGNPPKYVIDHKNGQFPSFSERAPLHEYIARFRSVTSSIDETLRKPEVRAAPKPVEKEEPSWLDRVLGIFSSDEAEDAGGQDDRITRQGLVVVEHFHQAELHHKVAAALASRRVGSILGRAAWEMVDARLPRIFSSIVSENPRLHGLRMLTRMGISGTALDHIGLCVSPLISALFKMPQNLELPRFHYEVSPTSKTAAGSTFEAGSVVRSIVDNNRNAVFGDPAKRSAAVNHTLAQMISAYEHAHPHVAEYFSGSPFGATVANQGGEEHTDHRPTAQVPLPHPTSLHAVEGRKGDSRYASIDVAALAIASSPGGPGTPWPNLTHSAGLSVTRMDGAAAERPTPVVTPSDVSAEATLHTYMSELRQQLRTVYGADWGVGRPGMMVAGRKAYGGLHPLLPCPVRWSQTSRASEEPLATLRAREYSMGGVRRFVPSGVPFWIDWFALPTIVPSWFGTSAPNAKLCLSTLAYPLLHEADVRLKDGCIIDELEASTMLSCFGFVPEPREPDITLAAFQYEDMMYLSPVWHPSRLRRRYPLRSDLAAQENLVYNGCGSGVFFDSARERLRMSLKDALDEASKAAEEAAQREDTGTSRANAGERVARKQSWFLEQELTYIYGIADDTSNRNAGRSRASTTDNIEWLRTVANKLRGAKAIQTFESGSRDAPHLGPLSGALNSDFLRRVRSRILGVPYETPGSTAPSNDAHDPVPAVPSSQTFMQPPTDVPGFGPPVAIAPNERPSPH